MTETYHFCQWFHNPRSAYGRSNAYIHDNATDGAESKVGESLRITPGCRTPWNIVSYVVVLYMLLTSLKPYLITFIVYKIVCIWWYRYAWQIGQAAQRLLSLTNIFFYQIRLMLTQCVMRRSDACKYHKTSNISRTLVYNNIVDHSDVVGASPVSAAPTTSSYLT